MVTRHWDQMWRLEFLQKEMIIKAIQKRGNWYATQGSNWGEISSPFLKAKFFSKSLLCNEELKMHFSGADEHFVSSLDRIKNCIHHYIAHYVDALFLNTSLPAFFITTRDPARFFYVYFLLKAKDWLFSDF